MDSAEFLDLLGNENRRRILQLLARKPCYVTEISEFLGVSPKAVIDHLRKLEEAGLVNSRTDDRRRKYFSINQHVRLEVTVSPYEFGTKSAYPASTRLDLTACRRLSIDIDEFSTLEESSKNDTGGQSKQDGTQRTKIRETTNGESIQETANGEQRLDGVDESRSLEETGDDYIPETPSEERRHGESSEKRSLEEDPSDEGSGRRLLTGSGREVTELATRLHDLKQLERELSLAQRWTQGQITKLRDALGQAVGNGDPRLISELLLALADGAKEAEELGRELDVPVSIVEEVLEELTIDGVVYRDGHEWCLDT